MIGTDDYADLLARIDAELGNVPAAAAQATPEPPGETVEDVLAAWRRHGRASGHSDRTISTRAYTVDRLARSVDPLTATREDLTRWLSELTDGRTGVEAKRSSKATYRAQLRAFYVWLVDTGRREDDPSAKLPRVRVARGEPRPFTPAQVDAILAACTQPRSRMVRAYVILACYAGLRVHEIAKVRGEDVQGDELRVLGKGGHEAWLPMHPAVQSLAAAMPAAGWWFPTDAANGHMLRCSVSSAIKRAMRRAGVPGTPHAARHFYGTQVLQSSGGNLRVAQRALRHANVATTAIYTQVADADLRRAVSGVPDPCLGGRHPAVVTSSHSFDLASLNLRLDSNTSPSGSRASTSHRPAGA